MIATLLLAWVVWLAALTPGSAPGWPQWGGPTRDFVVDGAGLASTWPADGPKRLWTYPLGDGFAPVVADDGVVYAMSRKETADIVTAMDAATGRVRWEFRYEAPFVDRCSMQIGGAPRATPLIAGGRIFTVSANGMMHALELASGAVVWKHDFAAEFKAEIRACGYANSPLAYKDTILLPVGGPGHGFVAFDQRDGRVRWHVQDFQNAYASPMLIDVDGRPEAVFVTAADIVGIDPDTGALRWRHPHPTSQGVNVTSPIWAPGNLLFVSSAYDTGSRVLQLTRNESRTEVKEVWFHSRLRIHFGNAVRVGARVYGSSGDAGVAPLSAVAIDTGSVVWRDRKVGRASLLVAGGRFIILDEDGVLSLATPTDEGLTVHSRAQVLTRSAWTVPTLAGTTLYVRDRQQLVALDLGGGI